MILRDWSVFLRGFLVGREGVEPSTKRLRVSRSPRQFVQKEADFPLIASIQITQNNPCFGRPLRDIGTYGRYRIAEVLHRGKPTLRYLRHDPTAAVACRG